MQLNNTHKLIQDSTDEARRLIGLDVRGTITLAQLNDAGVPFPVIADIIDAAL